MAEKWTIRAIGELGYAFQEDLDDSELRLARKLASVGIVTVDYVERPGLVVNGHSGRWRYVRYSLSGEVSARFSPDKASFLTIRNTTYAETTKINVGKNSYGARGDRNLKRKFATHVGIGI